MTSGNKLFMLIALFLGLVALLSGCIGDDGAVGEETPREDGAGSPGCGCEPDAETGSPADGTATVTVEE